MNANSVSSVHPLPNAAMSPSLSNIVLGIGTNNPMPPPQRRGSVPAGMILAHAPGRRRSSSKYASTTVPLQSSVSPNSSPNTEFAKSSSIFKNSMVTPDSLRSDSHAKPCFRVLISPFTLYFRDGHTEAEFRSHAITTSIYYTKIYIAFSIFVSAALFILQDFYEVNSTTPMRDRIAFPCGFVAMQVLALLASHFLHEIPRNILLPWISVGLLHLHVLGGVILHDMVNRASPTFYRSTFLFCTCLVSTALLLRIPFTHAAVSSIILWISYMIAATRLDPVFPTTEYVFVSILTLVLIGILLRSVYVSEVHTRNAFYQKHVHPNNKYPTASQNTTQKDLKSLNSGLDLSSPIEKAGIVVRQLLANPKLDHVTANGLTHILHLIQSSNPMLPDFVGLSSDISTDVYSKANFSSSGLTGKSNMATFRGSHARTRTFLTEGGTLDKESEKWIQNEVVPRVSQLSLPLKQIGMKPSHSDCNQSLVVESRIATTPYGSPLPTKQLGAPSSDGLSVRFVRQSSKKLIISDGFSVELDGACPCQIRALQFHDRFLDFFQLTTYFETMNRWDWPVFEFSSAAFGMPLVSLAAGLFSREHLFESVQIPIDKFMRCVHTIERGYSSTVVYHNSTHATDVLHGCHALSQTEPIRGAISGIERAALYFAAIIHDHLHPGFSNVFLIEKGDPKAITYNDRSVLEQFHLATAFSVMQQTDCNFTADWDPAQRRLFRQLVIDLVLATDLKMQAEIITQWKTRIDCFDVRLPADRHMLLKIIIKASDVANPTKSLPIYREWIDRIMSEFFQQGDEERRLGLPISPYCDSTQPNIPGSQVGFMTWVVCPLYEALHLVVPIPIQVGQLRANLEYWKSAQLQAQAQAASIIRTATLPIDNVSDSLESFVGTTGNPRSNESLGVKTCNS